ncbi:GNAT family N-acetyltransferase [Halocatena salina]|uniref:GNAT family N-acetyltransferase n=1 Tax=Halocatena salina TaxID=2934340 RepID=A0A8U0A3X8_9EURY|nr:GNAT family N-acetyltransferase [Halocatena salina]UPM43556.1 GNAT family N-acetyltransferase [Halocatena salina]
MQFSDELEFTHRDRKDVYEHVERYGTVEYEAARTALNMEPSAFGHHVAILKRDGIIREDDNHLSVAFESGTEQRFSEDDVEVVIRQAHESDLSGLVGAIRMAIDDETYIVAENIADIVDHENVLLRHNDLRSRVFFVATVNEDVVGWVHLNAPEIEKLSHTAELTVGVLPAYRGYGIGSHLLQRGLEWATEQEYEKVYNSVPSTNEEAIEFLDSHGWETEAVREDHYLIDGEYIDEVMMAVSL